MVILYTSGRKIPEKKFGKQTKIAMPKKTFHVVPPGPEAHTRGFQAESEGSGHAIQQGGDVFDAGEVAEEKPV